MAKWRAVKRQGKTAYVDLEAVTAVLLDENQRGHTRLFLVGGKELIVEGNPKDFVPED